MEKSVFVCTLRPTLESGASSLNGSVHAGDTEFVPKSRVLCIHAKASGNHLIRASKCHCTKSTSDHSITLASELGRHVNKQGASCSLEAALLVDLTDALSIFITLCIIYSDQLAP